MSTIGFRDVEIDGSLTEVAVEDGVVTAVGRGVVGPGAEAVDGRGGALIPGLWDHHVHLLAWAAALGSVDVATDLAGPLRSAAASRAAGGWIRATGYHESVAGDLDRQVLDAIVPAHPLRVQHRSGALWILNSPACVALGLDDAAGGPPGAERDETGRPTGRLLGADGWLRDRLGTRDDLDLGGVGRRLAAFGVVGVTDMTPHAEHAGWERIADAARSGELSQQVVVTGGPALVGRTPPAPLRAGPVKLYLADHDLPALDDLAGQVADAHAAGRPVAFHSVTRTSLALAIAALDAGGGARPGDRVEHGAVVPPELAAEIAARRLTVVTQPAFVADRGDQYRTDVEADNLPHLYPCAGLRRRGVPVAGSTDAPFGDGDPWTAIAAAVHRRTRRGHVMGRDERLTPAAALALFLGDPGDPGGPARRIEPGAPADLCLLDAPLGEALGAPTSAHVAATFVAGQVVHGTAAP